MVLVSCEQLKHLKEIMGPLIELSAALDTQVPNAEALFRVGSSGSKAPLIDENGESSLAQYLRRAFLIAIPSFAQPRVESSNSNRRIIVLPTRTQSSYNELVYVP